MSAGTLQVMRQSQWRVRDQQIHLEKIEKVSGCTNQAALEEGMLVPQNSDGNRTVMGMLVLAGESWVFLSFTDWWCEFGQCAWEHLVCPCGSCKGVWFTE